MFDRVLDALEVATVIGLWAGFLIRIPAATRSRWSALWWLAIFAEALSMTAAQPAIGRTVNEISGVPNIESLLKHLTCVWFEASILYIVSIVAGRNTRRNRRRLCGLTLATALSMSILFALATNSAGPYFLPANTELSPLMGYWLLFATYVGSVSVIAFFLFWRYRNRPSSKRLEISLKLIAVCFAAGVCFATLRILMLFSPEMPLLQPMRLTLYLGLLSFVAGSSLSALPDLTRIWTRYRSLRQLYPLWKTVYSVAPHIALIEPRGTLNKFRFDRLNLRLYRRVIETRDGLITLRAYIPSALFLQTRVAVAENIIPEENTEIVTIACVLELAHRAKLRGDPPASDNYTKIFGNDDLPNSNLDTEIRHLCAISQAFCNPLVYKIADLVEAPRLRK